MISLLHHSVKKHAVERPLSTAFRCREKSLSYQELHQKSSQLANLLLSAGIKNLDRIGIYMGKDLWLPVATYGILVAGAAYVPIDPNSRQERVEFILKDCDIEVLITSQDKQKLLQKIVGSKKTNLRIVIGLGEATIEGVRSIPWSTITKSSSVPPNIKVQEDDLAYIMYTSGSTGVPKGLMHTHRSGLAYVRHSAELYNVTSQDILGNHAPLHFDISTFEFLTGPYAGATSVLIPEEEIMFPQSLAQLIEREKLTFWYSVPLALIQILTRSDLSEVNLSSLRWVLFGGEPFPPKYVEQLMAVIPGARFCNVYGPAEVNQCTYYILPQNFKDDSTPIPIGYVWQGATDLIVDENDRAVSTNEVGELLISSCTMMHGYWARPDLNKNAFYFEEPIAGFKRRYYRTGDLVKKDENGILHFYGRKDRQIKIRGYRLELDEVEAVFIAQAEIEEAVAVITTKNDEKDIVLAVILHDSKVFDCKMSLDSARLKLPHYGIPSRIEILSSFPRTPTGKPDRERLTRNLQEIISSKMPQ